MCLQCVIQSNCTLDGPEVESTCIQDQNKQKRKEKQNKTKPLIMKCGARYSQNTDKPTIWYPQSSPCICCLGLVFFLDMGRNIWIQLDNLHSSLRVSGAWHPDHSREAGRSAPVPCGEGDCTACSSVDSTAEVCAAPLFPTGYRMSKHAARVIPEYMIFCCHEGPRWSLSLLAICPPHSICRTGALQLSSIQDDHTPPCSILDK